MYRNTHLLPNFQTLLSNPDEIRTRLHTFRKKDNERDAGIDFVVFWTERDRAGLEQVQKCSVRVLTEAKKRDPRNNLFVQIDLIQDVAAFRTYKQNRFQNGMDDFFNVPYTY
jgi:hypothetical protein